MTSLPSLVTGPRSNADATGSASNASSSTIAAPPDGLLLDLLSASAVSSVPPAGNGRRWPSWSLSEVKLLIQCVDKYGVNWQKVQDAFRRAGGTRGRCSLQRIYEQLCEVAAREQRAAQQAQAAPSASTAAFASLPLQAQASSSLQTPSVAPALAPTSPPSLPSLPHVSAQDSSWMRDEEVHLLQIALQHPDLHWPPQPGEDESYILDQVDAVFDSFCARYPGTTRDLRSVHTKCFQLLQQYREGRQHEHSSVALAESDESNNAAPGGSEEGREAAVGESQEDQAERDGGEGCLENLALAAVNEGTTASSNEQQVDQQAAHTGLVPTISDDAPMSEQAEPAAATAFSSGNTSSLDHEGAEAPSTVAPQSNANHNTSFSHDAWLDFHFHNLDHGFRFECVPTNVEICIHSATHWHFSGPATGTIESGSCAAAAPLVIDMLPNGSLLGLRMPPGTQVQTVKVDKHGESVKPGDPEKPVAVETHLSPESFRVVFFAPL